MKAGIFNTTIQTIESFGDDIRHFRLSFPSDIQFDFKAGQFLNFMFDFPDAGKTIKRPYSIASPPRWKGTVDIVWKRIDGGLVTNHLWNMKQGDALKVQGPLGIFTIKRPLPKSIIFVSTGTGIAPFRSMIHELLEEGADCDIWNLFGNRYETDILYRREFEDLQRHHPRFHNLFTVSRPQTWKGETQYVQFLLKKHFPDPHDKHIYICGLSAMIDEVKKAAEEIGFTRQQLFYEKYD